MTMYTTERILILEEMAPNPEQQNRNKKSRTHPSEEFLENTFTYLLRPEKITVAAEIAEPKFFHFPKTPKKYQQIPPKNFVKV